LAYLSSSLWVHTYSWASYPSWKIFCRHYAGKMVAVTQTISPGHGMQTTSRLWRPLWTSWIWWIRTDTIAISGIHGIQ
jgi:hypothetical protein